MGTWEDMVQDKAFDWDMVNVPVNTQPLEMAELYDNLHSHRGIGREHVDGHMHRVHIPETNTVELQQESMVVVVQPEQQL